MKDLIHNSIRHICLNYTTDDIIDTLCHEKDADSMKKNINAIKQEFKVADSYINIFIVLITSYTEDGMYPRDKCHPNYFRAVINNNLSKGNSGFDGAFAEYFLRPSVKK